MAISRRSWLCRPFGYACLHALRLVFFNAFMFEYSFGYCTVFCEGYSLKEIMLIVVFLRSAVCLSKCIGVVFDVFRNVGFCTGYIGRSCSLERL